MIINRENFMINRDEIVKVINKHGTVAEVLLPILEEIQTTYSYISEDIINIISEEINIPTSDIYSVGSFYSFLNIKSPEKYVVSLCKNISCNIDDNYKKVSKELERQLEIKFGETTKDGYFTLKFTDCLGMCDQGPAVIINEKVYTKLSPDKIKDILQEYRHKKKI